MPRCPRCGPLGGLNGRAAAGLGRAVHDPYATWAQGPRSGPRCEIPRDWLFILASTSIPLFSFSAISRWVSFRAPREGEEDCAETGIFAVTPYGAGLHPAGGGLHRGPRGLRLRQYPFDFHGA